MIFMDKAGVPSVLVTQIQTGKQAHTVENQLLKCKSVDVESLLA